MAGLSEFLYHRFDTQVADKGLYIVDIDVVPHAKSYNITFYVDKPGSTISLDECELVSRMVSAALDEDAEFDTLTKGYHYVLEVSSPGLNKTLKNARELKYFKGRRVEMKLKTPIHKDYHVVADLVETKATGEVVSSLTVKLKDKDETIEIDWKEIKLIKLFFEV